LIEFDSGSGSGTVAVGLKWLVWLKWLAWQCGMVAVALVSGCVFKKLGMG
jgi:hypothetical protein